MNRLDYPRFAKLMALLCLAFKEQSKKERIELYFQYLRDLPIEDIEYAVDQIIKSRRYTGLPTIGTIRQAAELGKNEEIEIKANKAWADACNNIEVGIRRIDDKIGNEAIEMAFGSWERFGNSDPTLEAADRKHFIRCYKIIAQKKFKEKTIDRGLIVEQFLPPKKKPKALIKGGLQGKEYEKL